LFGFALVTLLSAGPAQASIFSWLEELSGPGPFHGDILSATVLCNEGGTWKLCAVPNRDAVKQTITFKIGRYESEDGPRFKDLPLSAPDNAASVIAVPVSVFCQFRLHRSLDVGPGAGFMRLSGRGFDPVYKLSLTPLSASFTPFALNAEWAKSEWAYIVRVELDTSYFPQGFKGTDFNNSQTTFDSGPEFLTRTGIVFDVTAIGGAIRSILRR
jgi:hypothetical protein